MWILFGWSNVDYDDNCLLYLNLKSNKLKMQKKKNLKILLE